MYSSILIEILAILGCTAALITFLAINDVPLELPAMDLASERDMDGRTIR